MKSLVLLAGVLTVFLASAFWLHASPQAPHPHQTVFPPKAGGTQAQPVPLVATTHTIGTPTAAPSTIVVNTPTPVTVTVTITDPALIPGSLNLLRLGATGTQPTILGTMQNSGNGNYTIQTTFNEADSGQIQLAISGAFRGALTRATSSPLVVPIFKTHTDAAVGVSVQFPPDLFFMAAPSGVGQEFVLQSTPAFIGLGESFNTANPGEEPSPGYLISISSNSYGIQPFDIENYISTSMPGYDIVTTTQITVSGLTAYSLTFNDANAPKPLVIIPHGTTVYEVSYNSTFDPGTPSEALGLTDFETVLQHLQFLK